MKTYDAYMAHPAGGERIVKVFDDEGDTTVAIVVWLDESGKKRFMHEYRHNLKPILYGDASLSFRFATDSEYGYLCAESFEEACEQLERMVPPDTRDDGGWGWVETAEPRWQRYHVGVQP